MGYMDKIIEEVKRYNPPLTKKKDFDIFWKKTKEIAYSIPLNPRKESISYPIEFMKVYKISYNGFDKTPIIGWFIIPNFDKKKKYPCVIHYPGYMATKGRPVDYSAWILMGIAVLAIDIREQNGETGNYMDFEYGSSLDFYTKGVLNKEDYYLRAVYMDCVKAIDFVCEQKEIDTDKIIVEGGSQGGGLSLAVSSLDERPVATLCDVPSYCDFFHRVVGNYGALSVMTEFLKKHPDDVDKVFDTLSYYDLINHADRIKSRVFASVGLQDNICPAKLFFGVYNKIKSEKEVYIYPFNGHEGGGSLHFERKLVFVKKLFFDNK